MMEMEDSSTALIFLMVLSFDLNNIIIVQEGKLWPNKRRRILIP